MMVLASRRRSLVWLGGVLVLTVSSSRIGHCSASDIAAHQSHRKNVANTDRQLVQPAQYEDPLGGTVDIVNDFVDGILGKPPTTPPATNAPVAAPSPPPTQSPTTSPVAATAAPTTSGVVVTTDSPTVPPVVPETAAPVVSTTLAPVATTAAPVPATTAAPVPATTAAPVVTTAAPVATTTTAPVTTSNTVVSVVVGEDDLLSLQAAVITADLVKTLASMPGPYTLFAPNDVAFVTANQQNDGLVTKLLVQPEWVAHLRAFLLYHVVGGNQTLLAADLTDGFVINATLYPDAGPLISTINVDGDVVFNGDAFSGSKVVQADLTADNGVVHKVDKVFMPSFLTKNLFETAETIDGFGQVLRFITQAGLEETLRSGTVTIFLPTMDAFTALPPEFIGEIATNPQTVKLLFSNHIVEGVWPKERLTDGLRLTMLTGFTYKVSVTVEGAVLLGDVPIADADILASNGLAHTMDGVLIPPEPGDPTLSPTPPPVPIVATVAPVMPAPGIPTTTPGLTPAPVPVVAATSVPTPAVPAPVTTTAPVATSVPTAAAPTPVTTTAPQPTSSTDAPVVPIPDGNTVVAVVVREDDLSSLETAVVTSASLVDLLSMSGPYTVFAPTDDAFAVANEGGLVSKLLMPQWDAHLEALLRYHIIGDETLLSAVITDGLELPLTLYPEGGPLTASVMMDGVVSAALADGQTLSLSGEAFSGSKVIEADLTADNGVVHKVDKVFTPTFLTKNLYETAETIEGFELALPFITQAGLEETLRTGTVTIFAPSNEAFSALPPAFLAQVGTNPEAVRELFSNHIVEGIWSKARLTDGLRLKTLSGYTYMVTVNETSGEVRLGNVPIDDSDILASNGLAHTLDGVLLPPEPGDPTLSPTPPPVAAPGETPQPVAAPTLPQPTPPLPTPSTEGYPCSVCEPGMIITKADKNVNIPPGFVAGIESASCNVVDAAVSASPRQFNEATCTVIRNLYMEDCGCVPFTGPPAQAPVVPVVPFDPSVGCTVCPPGESITRPKNVVPVPDGVLVEGISYATCDLMARGLVGNPQALDQYECATYRAIYGELCACRAVPTAAPTVSPAPTRAPTSSAMARRHSNWVFGTILAGGIVLLQLV